MASLKSAASTFAAPGSPGRDDEDVGARLARRSPVSSFLPSSNFTTTVSAGLSRPVFAVDSTNEAARMSASSESRLSTLVAVDVGGGRADAPPRVRRVFALSL